MQVDTSDAPEPFCPGEWLLTKSPYGVLSGAEVAEVAVAGCPLPCDSEPGTAVALSDEVLFGFELFFEVSELMAGLVLWMVVAVFLLPK
jgi:hypothetical protein